MNQSFAIPPSRTPPFRFGFVCAASRAEVLKKYLLASPCLSVANVPQVIQFNASSAAEVFNVAVSTHDNVDWWIWVHQDVFLPGDWLSAFQARLSEAITQWPNLAVVGAYGISRAGSRAGNVLDRGDRLQEPLRLPVLAQSLDELLIAVRADSNLRMDPGCHFDFYASDLVQQALRKGLDSAILDLYCEHWSETPRHPPFALKMLLRIKQNAAFFESKWCEHLPIETPVLSFPHLGAATQQMDHLINSQVS